MGRNGRTETTKNIRQGMAQKRAAQKLVRQQQANAAKKARRQERAQ